MQPDPATLRAWAVAWSQRKREAYQELVASYTPEQRAIIRRMNEASRQSRLCWARISAPDGRTGKRAAGSYAVYDCQSSVEQIRFVGLFTRSDK